MKKLLYFIFVSLISFNSIPQEIDTSKLDTYLNTLANNDKFMGSVALIKDGNITYSNAVGYVDTASKQRATAATKYRIGSISKTFTTVLIFKAIEEEKLSLSQTIETFFPTLTNASSITIKQLLGHRSGIHNFTNDAVYQAYYTNPVSKEKLIDIIVKAGTDFEPDSKAAYSNSNFVLLTFILEDIFNASYASLLETYITSPLQLQNTYVGSSIDIENQECNSYSYVNGWQKSSETDMSVPQGAGAIVSTPADILLFCNALFEGAIIKLENVELMKTMRDQVGLGLFQFPFYNKISYGHTGGIDNFSSVFSYFPEEKLGYALTSNGSNYNNNNISIAVLSAAFNLPYEIPTFERYSPSEEALAKYIGVYASSDLPIKITITREGNALFGQATGQSAFPLSATQKDRFVFDQAGIKIDFSVKDSTLTLHQGGGSFIFTKE